MKYERDRTRREGAGREQEMHQKQQHTKRAGKAVAGTEDNAFWLQLVQICILFLAF